MAGCTEAEIDSYAGTAGSTSAISLPPERAQFDQAITIDWISVPREQAQEVRAQATGVGLEQRIADFASLTGHSVPLPLENGTPTAIVDGSGHRGVWATSASGIYFSVGTLTYRWTFPDPHPTKPSLVEIVRPNGEDFYVPVTGSTAEVKIDIDGNGETVHVNGQFVYGDFAQRGQGIPLPSFRSAVPGAYSIEVSYVGTKIDEESVDGVWTYNQKGLQFAHPFPQYDLGSSDPVSISNQFSWSNGTPVLEPAWNVSVDHRLNKSGTGTDISATWNPSDNTLARVRAQEEPTPSLESVDCTVEASAIGYPATSDYSATRSTVFHGGNLPARQGELRIINEQIDPDPPFEEPGSTVDLTANAVTIATDRDPAEITWTVKLVDPEGTEVAELSAGFGPNISASWDGTVRSQAVEDPGLYSFKINAQLCDDVIISEQRVDRAVRAQTNGCLVAQAAVAMMSIGTEYLRVSVTPYRVEPSQMVAGETNEVDVEVRLVKMPPGHSDLLVRLSSEVFRDPSRPESDLLYRGGHDHDESGRPPATFTVDSYRFGQPGVFRTKLQAPPAGARLKIFAKPADASLRPATCHLLVEVPGLTRLLAMPESSVLEGYLLIGGAGYDNQLNPSKPDVIEHPSNHWGTAEMLSAIRIASSKYMAQNMVKFKDHPGRLPTRAEKLLVNDISLPRGGVFDTRLNWSRPEHSEHAAGVVADVSAGPEAHSGGNQTDPAFVKIWSKQTRTEPFVEGDHLHIRLTGERK